MPPLWDKGLLVALANSASFFLGFLLGEGRQQVKQEPYVRGKSVRMGHIQCAAMDCPLMAKESGLDEPPDLSPVEYHSPPADGGHPLPGRSGRQGVCLPPLGPHSRLVPGHVGKADLAGPRECRVPSICPGGKIQPQEGVP
jgi:hypothetical protein